MAEQRRNSLHNEKWISYYCVSFSSKPYLYIPVRPALAVLGLMTAHVLCYLQEWRLPMQGTRYVSDSACS